MKSFVKIVLTVAALGIAGSALASKPAKGADGKPGYTAFCAELKKDCAKTRKCEYEEKHPGTKDMSCLARAFGPKDQIIHDFDKMCEHRGLKHSEVLAPGHENDKNTKSKFTGSICYVK